MSDSNPSPENKLNFADLLQSEEPAGGSLSDYLHFTYDAASNSTVVNVSMSGHISSGADQQIVLPGVGDLTNGGANSDLNILQSLLATNQTDYAS